MKDSLFIVAALIAALPIAGLGFPSSFTKTVAFATFPRFDMNNDLQNLGAGRTSSRQFINQYNPLLNVHTSFGRHALKYGFRYQAGQSIQFNPVRSGGYFLFDRTLTQGPNPTVTSTVSTTIGNSRVSTSPGSPWSCPGAPHRGIHGAAPLSPDPRWTPVLDCNPTLRLRADVIAIVPAAHAIINTDVRGNETILAVEDQDQVRTLAVTVLERYGYRVLSAAGGDEAVALANAFRGAIDLLLTDIVMPGMDGRSLANKLAAERSLRVLFMSGYTENAITHRSILDGELNYIQKPFTPESLAGKVREVLGPPRSAGSH
jgi:CheY-like chemotaxis protein